MSDDRQPQVVLVHKSFVGPALICWGLYYIGLWLIGAIMNFVYLAEARRLREATGRSPSGMGCLLGLLVTHFCLPLALAMVLLLLMAFGVVSMSALAFWDTTQEAPHGRPAVVAPAAQGAVEKPGAQHVAGAIEEGDAAPTRATGLPREVEVAMRLEGTWQTADGSTAIVFEFTAGPDKGEMKVLAPPGWRGSYPMRVGRADPDEAGLVVWPDSPDEKEFVVRFERSGAMSMSGPGLTALQMWRRPD